MSLRSVLQIWVCHDKIWCDSSFKGLSPVPTEAHSRTPVHYCRSITWNIHRRLSQPPICSIVVFHSAVGWTIFLTRRKNKSVTSEWPNVEMIGFSPFVCTHTGNYTPAPQMCFVPYIFLIFHVPVQWQRLPSLGDDYFKWRANNRKLLLSNMWTFSLSSKLETKVHVKLPPCTSWMLGVWGVYFIFDERWRWYLASHPAALLPGRNPWFSMKLSGPQGRPSYFGDDKRSLVNVGNRTKLFRLLNP